jgi:hypothetical protein
MFSGPELIILANLVAFGIIGWLVGQAKGRPVLGAILGAVLGVIGVIVIVLVPKANSSV